MIKKDPSKIPIEVLPDSLNALYEQRESGRTHSAFSMEYMLYQAIQAGNKAQVIEIIDVYLGNGLVVGRLSDNSMNQMKYWSIACISVAIHYAILGGLDETDAFNLSDTYIRHVDKLTAIEDCIPYLKEKALELASLVARSKNKNTGSPYIRKCLHFINVHLHDRLTIASIAKELGISRDYLSTLFQQEMQLSLHKYIVREKLEASKALLMQNLTYGQICYQLSFCSETHYINCFKRQYGITPGNYKRQQYI
ncbi:MAG: AraC family transcriptional regulator [Clostridia bacterium]|nr:AraC family transcriptional regulator [Clostridia bacterium]